jgi:putative transcriptional regulator
MSVTRLREPKKPSVLINRLSRLLGERRLSLQDVVRGTGLSRQTVHDLYHDNSSRLDLDTLNKLCAYLEVGPGDIFEWERSEGDPPPAPAPSAGRRTAQ